ncbi:MAG: Gfo/Idh/MocA family oxidoreductase [Bryobacterales bacterium]|nr:Gfo/Idh/MocA family oxidoreductase [Bryobacterales bacterium]
MALIGVWGRGTAHYASLRNENVVALCDVYEPRTREAQAMFPKAKCYTDWRKVMEQKDVEAMVICTADQHHAFIANWAINRGMHVFCEKPLGMTVQEARVVRANYLKNRAKIATQHGTQRHAYPNFERVRELILDGAIGQLQRVHSWDARELPRPGYPQGEGAAPQGLDFDQWIGPSPVHPYSPQYFGGSSGLNCLFWNMYRDFGVGQMGDMGAHTMDLVWNVIDAGAPSSIIAPVISSSGPMQPMPFPFSVAPAATPIARRKPPEKTLLKRIMLRLQDNRMEPDDDDEKGGTPRRGGQRNPVEEDSAAFAMLKTVLNAVFVTTGLALLLSVIIVIIYTSIGKFFVSTNECSTE